MDILLHSVKVHLVFTWGPSSKIESGKWNEDNESQIWTYLWGPAAHTCELLPTAGLLCSQSLPRRAYYFHYEYKPGY